MKKILRIAIFSLLCTAVMTACNKKESENPPPPTPPPAPAEMTVNEQTDAYLRERYLWNDEYKTLKPDFSLEYNTFLEKTLMSMTQNTLDKKLNSNNTYSLYSFITREPLAKGATLTTRGVNHGVLKKTELGYGFISLTPFTFSNAPGMGFQVNGVYPDSPAAKAGIDRDYAIIEVDGKEFDLDNYLTVYESLMTPGAVKTVVLSKNAPGLPTTTVTSAEFFPNPVLKTEIIQTGGKKIGYIAYERFDVAYDDELLAAIATVKQANVDDMILDLRINGGGHTWSCQMLSSCIGGQRTHGRIFQYYRYNDRRMANPVATSEETGLPYDNTKKLFYDEFLGSYWGVDLQPYFLNIPRLYILISGHTASASEAVINGLKGIDIPIILIGMKTNGKNAGMEPTTLKDKNYQYQLAPITFQCYNAKGQTVNSLGIVPDYEVDDWDWDYVPFGNTSDPMLAQALNLITGVSVSTAYSHSPRSRNTTIPLKVDLPEVVSRPNGMIQLPSSPSEEL